ncbi:MAG: response regulator, partial [Bacteroidota bacterium]
MKVLIIEDEPLAAEKLKRQLLALRQRITVAGWVSSVGAAVDWLGQHSVDLIVMDIQLEDGISFQLFEQMEIEVPIIFTTAYDEFAIKAFQVNSLDYLLKPFTTSDLQRAMDKYERWAGGSASLQVAYANLHQAMDKTGGFRERFLVTVGEQLYSLELAEVAYFFAEAKYVFLVRPDGRQ